MRIVCIGEGLIELTEARPAAPTPATPTGFAGEALATAWYLRRLVPETVVQTIAISTAGSSRIGRK